MKPVKKCPYLRQRPGSATYQFRMRIPQDLVAHYAKKSGEFSFSLHTKDLTEANRIAIEHATRYEMEFSRIRAGTQTRGATYLTDLNADELIPALAAYGRSLVLAVDDATRVEGLVTSKVAFAITAPIRSLLIGKPEDPEVIFAAWRGIINAELERARKGYAIGDSSMIDALLDSCLRSFVIIVDRKSDPYQRLRRSFLISHLEALNGVAERNDGNVVVTPLVPEEVLNAGRSKAPNGPDNSVSKGLTVWQLFEAWETEKGDNPKTVHTVKSVVSEFLSVAPRKWAVDVTRSDAVAYKDTLIAKQSSATALKKIGLLKAVFALAADNARIDVNPISGVKVAQPKVREKPRVAFSDDDLAVIFQRPLFTARDVPSIRSSGGMAAYWLPVIALFSGARLEEIGQLLVTDLKHKDGIHYFDFNPEGVKSLKTAASARETPIHPALIRLGILEYALSLPQSGRLFPVLRADKDGKLTAAFSKWFGRQKRHWGITDPKKTFHSFRHSFSTACRVAGLNTAVHFSLTGHSEGTVGGSYGDVPLMTKARALRKLCYPGFPL